MDRSAPPPRAADQTRAALIAAALDLFGRKGFDATSTRDIAAAAGVNIAGIAYHFGGKDGLRTACATHVAETMGALFAPHLAAPVAAPDAPQRLEQMVRGFIAFMLGRREAESLARFVVREQMDRTPAFDILYGGVFLPVHRHVCRLWAAATGQAAEAPATRLAVFALMGQALYFRLAWPIVGRRMNWRAAGPAQVAAVTGTVVANLHAALAAGRKA